MLSIDRNEGDRMSSYEILSLTISIQTLVVLLLIELIRRK